VTVVEDMSKQEEEEHTHSHSHHSHTSSHSHSSTSSHSDSKIESHSSTSTSTTTETTTNEKKSLPLLGFLSGTGAMGLKLARNHAKAGYPVIMGSREAKKGLKAAEDLQKQADEELNINKYGAISGGSNSDVAEKADIVFFCASGTLEDRSTMLKSLSKQLKGKIMVDVTNIGHLTSFADKWGQISSTDLCQSALPDARWICAYKSTFSASLDKPIDKFGLPLEVFVAGDDKEAKKTVIDSINATGFRALDCGPQKNIRILELMGPPFIMEMNKHSLSGSRLGSWRFR